MEAADFSGYATKAGLKCSDGRTIMPEAFKHQAGATVPLVWQHAHNEPSNVLGHVVLEERADGVYGYGFFNDTPQGQNAKKLVEHKDIKSLSIYANQLVERSKQVFHGVIREVSLVLSGANPGALIDNVRIAHSDDPNDVDTLEDEAIIYTGLELQHEDLPQKTEKKVEEKSSVEDPKEEKKVEHADADATVQDVYDSLNEDQKKVVHYMIGAALEAAAENTGGETKQSATDDSNTSSTTDGSDANKGDGISHTEGTTVVTNVFEQNGTQQAGPKLSHDDIKGIMQSATKSGSLKAAVEEYALAHGIENIDILFPDARTIDNTPEWIKRRTEWVASVLSGTRKTPFSRIKTRTADLTYEDARAKGYIKGNFKKEEFFGVAQRVTTPTTVYKKQKLDRDDMIDITDFDVVVWLKGEMRLMIEEEIARAILVGDGRDVADEDKIRDPAGSTEGAGIRAIVNDHELYVTTVNVNVDDANSNWGTEVVESVLRARRFYKGTGTPTFYTTQQVLVEMLLSKDSFGRRLYDTQQQLAAALMVDSIVPVEVMEDSTGLVGIIVNLADYAVGADRGGELTMFDDFDIDYNQYKYLIETRLSGALTKVKSAMVIRRTAASAVLVTPAKPSFNGTTLTIPTQTGTSYTVNGVAAADGSTRTLAEGVDAVVKATADSGYYLPDNASDEWTFTGR